MSSKDRRPYLSAVTLDQSLLNFCADNLENRLEMICEIETPSGGVIYASDRNKYVGQKFYEALLVFPVIGRTVGEWLTPELQFSTLQLELSNVDGRFNQYLPGGANFGGWIGKDVTVKLGLAEQSSTYTTVFSGEITDIGGFKRSTKSVTVIARDRYDKINVSFPNVAFSEAAYPKIETKYIGKIIPVIYGDWTVDNDPYPASVPATPTNSNDPFVHFKSVDVTISQSSPAICTAVNHDLDVDDQIEFETTGTLPSPLAIATPYFVKSVTGDTFQISTTMGGPSINTTTAGSGTHNFIPAFGSSKEDIEFKISDNALTDLDIDHVYLKRGEDTFYSVPSTEISVSLASSEMTIVQGSVWPSLGVAYQWDNGDEFFVRVKGKDLGSYDDNIVSQAKDILETYGGVVSGDFDASWDTYRDKASPAQSSISTIKSRVWIQEPQPVMQYALSMLEQVRLEAFIDRNLKLKINALHFEDWVASPTFTVKNWDVEEASFQTTSDERNLFNRAQGFFSFLPITGENALTTRVQKNTASITQIGKAISKKIEFPNLYKESDVKYQVIEIIRLASATIEATTANLTWRALLQDVGNFVTLDVKIGSAQFDSVPAMIRDIGYDPAGLKIPIRIWSFMMCPFPSYTPGFAGTVGGYNASITEE